MSKCDKSQCTQMYGTTLFAYLWVNAGLFWLVPSAPMVSPTLNVDALTNFSKLCGLGVFTDFSSCMYNQLLNPSAAPLLILEGWREGKALKVPSF